MAARRSVRLRETPRISYAEPEDDDGSKVFDGDNGPHNGNLTKAVRENDDDSDYSDFDQTATKPKTKRMNRGKSRVLARLDKHQIFHWQKLPGELRNMIYENCLSVKEGITLQAVSQNGRRILRMELWPPIARILLRTKILFVNKQIYHEGCPILYKNHFKFRNTHAMWMFLSTVSPTMKASITSLELLDDNMRRYFGGEPGAGCSNLMPTFGTLIGTKSLTNMTIHIGIRPGYDMKRVIPRVFRELYMWIEAVGREKGDTLAALSLIDFRCNVYNAYYPGDPFDWGSKSVPAADEICSQLQAGIRDKLG